MASIPNSSKERKVISRGGKKGQQTHLNFSKKAQWQPDRKQMRRVPLPWRGDPAALGAAGRPDGPGDRLSGLVVLRPREVYGEVGTSA